MSYTYCWHALWTVHTQVWQFYVRLPLLRFLRLCCGGISSCQGERCSIFDSHWMPACWHEKTLRLLLLLLCCSRWSVQLHFLTFHCIANDGKFRVFAAHAHKAWFCHNYVVDGANKFCMLFACGFNRKSLTPNTSLHYPYIVHSWEEFTEREGERVSEGSWREFWYNQKPK